MPQTYHIETTTAYADAILRHLIDEGIINELQNGGGILELNEGHKKAIDIELEAINNNPDYLLKWDEIKQRYKRP